MSSPSIQLDLEKALKAFITAQAIMSAPARPIYSAHEFGKDPEGTFLNIIADPPDWETMVINAIVRVTFELATLIKDPGTRTTAAVRHSTDLGRLIELLSQQNFAVALAALNIPTVGPDTRTWTGLGFTGWEAQEPEPDGTTDTQIVSRLPYLFEIFLED
jgi:hypothetical protein